MNSHVAQFEPREGFISPNPKIKFQFELCTYKLVSLKAIDKDIYKYYKYIFDILFIKEI